MNTDYLGSAGGSDLSTSTITIGTDTGTGIYTAHTGSFVLPTGSTVVDTINWNVNYIDPVQNQLDEIKTFMNEIKAERELRKKYPALDHAYEQYEIILDLCKSKEADDAAGENSQGT
jgi:hypothetical protein